MAAHILVAMVIFILASTDVLGAPSPFPTGTLSDATVPVCQWQQTINRTLAHSDSPAKEFRRLGQATSSMSLVYGADGTGLFLVSGQTSSRRRASDGGLSWANSVDGLPTDSTCGSPFMPQKHANHLYTLCSPNIVVKRWFDSGVVQWAVRVFGNSSTPLGTEAPPVTDTPPTLTQIVGLTSTISPSGLILASGVDGSMMMIDDRTGGFIQAFAPNLADFKPQPSTPFTAVTAINSYLLDYNSSIMLSAAHMTSGSTTSLVVFRTSLPSLALTSGGWYEIVIPDTSVDGKYTITVGANSLYIRTSSSLFYIDADTTWTVNLPSVSDLFRLDNEILEIAGGRYLITNRLAPVNGSNIQLHIIDTKVEPPALIEPISLSGVLSALESPWHLLVDSYDNIVFINSQRISSIPFNASLATAPKEFLWTFSLYERWSRFDSSGEPIGKMIPASWSQQAEFQQITGVSYLPDMLTGTRMMLVRTNDLNHDDVENMFAFTTRASPSCNVTSLGQCSSCVLATGLTTVRQCAFCPSTHTCAEIGYGSSSESLCANDPTFGREAAVCESGDDSDSHSQWLLGALIISLVLVLLIPVAWLIRKSRATARSRQPDASLKSSYQALSPDHSFSVMRSIPSSPSVHPVQPSSTALEEYASVNGRGMLLE